MPVLYLVVVVAAGLALVVDAAALAVDRHARVAWLTAGLVVVIALVVALAPGHHLAVPGRVRR